MPTGKCKKSGKSTSRGRRSHKSHTSHDHHKRSGRTHHERDDIRKRESSRRSRRISRSDRDSSSSTRRGSDSRRSRSPSYVPRHLSRSRSNSQTSNSDSSHSASHRNRRSRRSRTSRTSRASRHDLNSSRETTRFAKTSKSPKSPARSPKTSKSPKNSTTWKNSRVTKVFNREEATVKIESKYPGHLSESDTSVASSTSSDSSACSLIAAPMAQTPQMPQVPPKPQIPPKPLVPHVAQSAQSAQAPQTGLDADIEHPSARARGIGAHPRNGTKSQTSANSVTRERKEAHPRLGDHFVSTAPNLHAMPSMPSMPSVANSGVGSYGSRSNAPLGYQGSNAGYDAYKSHNHCYQGAGNLLGAHIGRPNQFKSDGLRSSKPRPGSSGPQQLRPGPQSARANMININHNSGSNRMFESNFGRNKSLVGDVGDKAVVTGQREIILKSKKNDDKKAAAGNGSASASASCAEDAKERAPMTINLELQSIGQNAMQVSACDNLPSLKLTVSPMDTADDIEDKVKTLANIESSLVSASDLECDTKIISGKTRLCDGNITKDSDVVMRMRSDTPFTLSRAVKNKISQLKTKTIITLTSVNLKHDGKFSGELQVDLSRSKITLRAAKSKLITNEEMTMEVKTPDEKHEWNHSKKNSRINVSDAAYGIRVIFSLNCNPKQTAYLHEKGLKVRLLLKALNTYADAFETDSIHDVAVGSSGLESLDVGGSGLESKEAESVDSSEESNAPDEDQDMVKTRIDLDGDLADAKLKLIGKRENGKSDGLPQPGSLGLDSLESSDGNDINGAGGDIMSSAASASDANIVVPGDSQEMDPTARQEEDASSFRSFDEINFCLMGAAKETAKLAIQGFMKKFKSLKKSQTE